MTKNCRVCGCGLVVGDNITQNGLDSYRYICKNCRREYRQSHKDQIREYHREYQQSHKQHRREYYREYRHRTGRSKPALENKSCPVFLGEISEKVLSKMFKNVERMPYGNPGYDFICGKGYKIDAKSACIGKNGSWLFGINKNTTADYFLCLAFDDRDNLNPLYVWLIPGSDVNHMSGISISPNTLTKWNKYLKPIDKVLMCCNTLKKDRSCE